MEGVKSYARRWAEAAAVRAVKTAAQSAVAALGTTAVITGVDWRVVAATAAMAAVLSLLTSVAGLPEVDKDGDGLADDDSAPVKEEDENA